MLVEAMGKRKLCAEDELVDLARRENELSLAQQRAMIQNVTDSDPRAVDLVIRTLRAHNFPLSLEIPSGASSRLLPRSRSALAQAARVENRGRRRMPRRARRWRRRITKTGCRRSIGHWSP